MVESCDLCHFVYTMKCCIVGSDVQAEYPCMGDIVASYLTVSIMVSCLTAISTNDLLILCMSSLQLSQLVIMAEDTEVEHAISDPVKAVDAAVANLIKVCEVRCVVCLLFFVLLCFD